MHSSSVHGLQGLTYLDKVKGGEKFQEQNEAVTFTGETDRYQLLCDEHKYNSIHSHFLLSMLITHCNLIRVYIDAPDSVSVRDSSNNTNIELRKHNLKDCVVWNAWIQKVTLSNLLLPCHTCYLLAL